jgi:hypothetical protein
MNAMFWHSGKFICIYKFVQIIFSICQLNIEAWMYEHNKKKVFFMRSIIENSLAFNYM